MRSKEFYEGSISRLQKMIKHGVYVLLFDAFAVAVQIPFIFAGKWVAAYLILSIAAQIVDVKIFFGMVVFKIIHCKASSLRKRQIQDVC